MLGMINFNGKMCVCGEKGIWDLIDMISSGFTQFGELVELKTHWAMAYNKMLIMSIIVFWHLL